MDFSKRPSDPRRHIVGIAIVVGIHLLLVYGLTSGLARKFVDEVRRPVETRLIEEPAPPAPPAPPQPVAPPPPKVQAPPPPPVVPPPEVRIAAPPPAPAITATPAPPAPEPVAAAPAAPPAPAPAPPAPPAPPRAAAPSVGVSCPGYERILQDAGFPREATRAQVDSGEVTVSFTIGTNGEVKHAAIVKSTHRAFNRHSLEAVSQFKCIGQPQEVSGVLVQLGFRSQ